MFESWFSSPDKVGGTVLLLSLVVSFFKGWLVPSVVHNRVIEECKTLKIERDELLHKLLQASELTTRATLSSAEITKIAQAEVERLRTELGRG